MSPCHEPVVQDDGGADQIRPVLGSLRLATVAVDAELEIDSFAAVGRCGIGNLPVGAAGLRVESDAGKYQPECRRKRLFHKTSARHRKSRWPCST